MGGGMPVSLPLGPAALPGREDVAGAERSGNLSPPRTFGSVREGTRSVLDIEQTVHQLAGLLHLRLGRLWPGVEVAGLGIWA